MKGGEKMKKKKISYERLTTGAMDTIMGGVAVDGSRMGGPNYGGQDVFRCEYCYVEDDE
jgi:hypothetical protein